MGIPIAFGIAKYARIWVGGGDSKVRQAIHRGIKRKTVSSSEPIDVAILTPQTPDEAAYFAAKVVNRLSDAGRIWIALPSTTPQGLSVHTGNDGAILLAPEPYVAAMRSVGFTPSDRVRVADEVRAYAFDRSPDAGSSP